MTTRTIIPEAFGPGHPHRAYLDTLAAGGITGWWDENGVPAAWPKDFLNPGSGWQPAGDARCNTEPYQPY